MSRQRPTRRRLIGTCYFSFPAALQRSLVPEIDANAGTLWGMVITRTVQSGQSGPFFEDLQARPWGDWRLAGRHERVAKVSAAIA
jgi:hypothetical protein